MKLRMFVLTVGAILGWTVASQAVLVMSGSTTNFYDNFETDTVGSQPTTGVGSWAYTPPITIVQSAPPGAAEGTKYLKLDRPAAPPRAAAIADFGIVSAGSGNKVTAIMSLYVPSSAGNEALQISLGPNSEADLAGFFTVPVWLQGETNNIHTYLNGVEIDTGVTFQDNVWQTLTIEYTFQSGNNNDDTFTVSVNGNTSVPINGGGFSNVTDPGILRYLSFRVGEPGSFFLLDAAPVPEPSVIGLLATGLFVLRRLRTTRTK